jgi:hypothetical protein
VDLNDGVSISPKGTEEVKSRVYKVGMRKRSVLILLETPRTMEYLISKSVLPRPELILEIEALFQEGFIFLGSTVVQPSASAPKAVQSDMSLKSGIVLSEAKFLMIDFWVDSFGTEAEEFTQEVGACENSVDLNVCLRKLIDSLGKNCPDRLPMVGNMIREINETA